MHLKFQLLNLSHLILEHIFRDGEALLGVHGAQLLAAVSLAEAIEAFTVLREHGLGECCSVPWNGGRLYPLFMRLVL